ncbi:DNA-binding transcriptional MerR regulator [Oikeobacillus pervagus]|uniref:DNA-binding transcriptional MerR regulator n=1 Tax=Oikeobacillus pervagus TaxID=1325931 RepID=A0AAJ1WK29_9BACI|nr:hypothetical protein [Oikeobacillus pervagus]MDQ0216078.1 DNA-binding transcriptional MerR regulator [Oikeobacillus pervagus]
MEKVYFSSEVAKNLGIGASTLRKYALSLEQQGYHFERGINNSRVFHQKDIQLIKQLIHSITKKNLPLEKAIDLILTNLQDETTVPVTVTTHDEEIEEAHPLETKLYERIEQLESNQVKLIEANVELAKQLDRHQQWLKDKIEELEIAKRDRHLIENLQQALDEKKSKPKRAGSIKNFVAFMFNRKREA